MKKSELTWFDRMMMRVTFAEEGVDFPVDQALSQRRDTMRAEQSMREMNPGEETVAPAQS